MRSHRRRLIAFSFVLALSGCGTAGVTTPSVTVESSVTVEPSATERPPVPGNGPIEPGTYSRRGVSTAVPFIFTMPAGWVGENHGITLGKRVGDPGEVSLNVYAIADIFSDACTGTEDERQEVGDTAEDLIRALMEQRNGAVMSEPIEIIIDGHPVTRIELTVSEELDLTTCRPPGPVGIQIWQDIAGKYFVLLGDGAATLYVADIGGERLVLTAAHWNASSPEDIDEMEAIVESIEFED